MTWIPESCALPTEEHPLRLAEFDELFTRATRAAERLDATRLRLRLPRSATATARDLASRETACCSFFAFDVRENAGEVLLDVCVPATRVAVLDAVHRRAEAARAAG